MNILFLSKTFALGLETRQRFHTGSFKQDLNKKQIPCQLFNIIPIFFILRVNNII